MAAVRTTRAGREIALEPKAFDLLLLLAANPDRVVEKAEIFERLWAAEFVSDNALTRVVATLRRALGDRPDRPIVIATVRTRGYRFLPAIEAVEETPRAADGGPARSPSPRSERRTRAWISVAVVAALAAIGVWLARRPEPARPTTAAVPSPVQLTTEAGNYFYPDFSPDGSQLVYASDVEGGLEIYVQPVSGGRATRLTDSGACSEPAWSPDGRWIVYTDLARGGLWLVAPSGGSRRQLTDFGMQAAWSPDGRWVVFSHPGQPVMGSLQWSAMLDSSLWAVEVGNGEIRRLTSAPSAAGGQGAPAVTTDGESVVFSTASWLGGRLWRVPITGGEPAALTSGAGDEAGAWWLDPTPDPLRDALYVIRRRPESTRIERVWLQGPARRETVLGPAPAAAAQLTVSKDGKWLAFVVEEVGTSIEELPVNGAGDSIGPPRALAAPPVERVFVPQYSPDGDLLFYRRHRAGSSVEGVIADRTGSVLQVVRDLPIGLTRWTSPTAVLLAPLRESVRLDALTGRKVPVAPLAGADRMIDRARGGALSVSPDLRAVALTASTGSGRELFVWEVGRQEPRQHTHLGGLVDFPSYTRDGRWILIQHMPRPEVGNGILRAPAGGGEPERILSGDGPSWLGQLSSHGDLVAYAAQRGGAWYLAVAGPRSPERLLDTPPEVVGYLRWPTWSPDGSRIAYERAHYRSRIWLLELDVQRRGRAY